MAAIPTPSAALDQATEQSLQRVFEDYELLELIARGGMGSVYRARQISLNRIVALKTIATGHFAPLAAAERFQIEVEAAARLEHPHIVPIYEVGVHEDQHFFTMRYLEGGTLRAALARKRYTPEEAVDLLLVLAGAVNHAHRFGILHRDIKPGNILFSLEGDPFVADFSLAKVLGSDSDLTRSSAALGTPSYMSPEQITGDEPLSIAVDVYGLGAVLYELLTGHPPFKGTTPLETMRQALEKEPARPRTQNTAVNRDLEIICLKCLQKEPARRYASAADLAEDLQAWRSNRPLRARPVSSGERILKWGKRNPAVASLVAALHVMALAGLLGIIWQARRAGNHAQVAILQADRANREATMAQAQFARAEEELWKARLSEATAIRVAGGPSARLKGGELLEKLVQRSTLTAEQRRILRQEVIAQFALADIGMGTHWIGKHNSRPLGWNANLDHYLRLGASNMVILEDYLSSKAITVLGGGVSDLDHAVLSADDRFAAAQFGDGHLRVWRVPSEQLIVQARVSHAAFPQGPSFSPDSAQLLLVSDDGLDVYSLAPLQPVKRLRMAHTATFARHAPDSKLIAAVIKHQHVEVLDSSSGETVLEIFPDFPAQRVAWHPSGEFLAIGGDRGRLQIHSLKLGGSGQARSQHLRSLVQHRALVNYLSFSQDGEHLFSSSWDGSSIIWEFRSGRRLLQDTRASFSQVSKTGNTVVLDKHGLSESVGHFQRPVGYQTLHSLGEGRELLGLWVSRDTRYGFVSYESPVGASEGECAVWDFTRGVPLGTVPGIWAQFSGNNRFIFAFERLGNRVCRYEFDGPGGVSLSTRKVVYEGEPGENVNTGELLMDGETLAIAATHRIVLLNTMTGSIVRRWHAHAHVLDASSDGRFLAAMFHQEPTVLWDATTGQELTRTPPFTEIHFSPDNKHYSVSTRQDVEIRKLSDHQPLYPPIENPGSSDRSDVRFSPDGAYFAFIAERRYVRLFETSTGKNLADLIPPGSEPNLLRLRFNSDGSWLVVAGNNGEMAGWKLPELRLELAKLGLDWELSISN